MIKSLGIIAVGLATLSAPSFAQQATAPAKLEAPASPALEAKALELAKILNSERIIIGNDKDNGKAVNMVKDLATASPALTRYSVKHPGFIEDLTITLMPVIDHYLRQRLPELQKRQATLYAKHFTSNELTYLVDFYGSPTGQKMIEQMLLNMKSEAVLAEAKRSPDFNFSTESVMKDVRATAPKVLQQLTAEDYKVLGELSRHTAAPKLRHLGPQTQAIALEWYQETAPGEDEAINAAILTVFAKYEKPGAKK